MWKYYLDCHILSRQFLIDAKLANTKNCGNYLIALEEAGFLVSEKYGKEKIISAPPARTIRLMAVFRGILGVYFR